MGLITTELTAVVDNFWSAIKIYILHPNAINKEVLYSETICAVKVNPERAEPNCQTIYEQLYFDIFVKNKNVEDAVKLLPILNEYEQVDVNYIFNELNGSYMIVRKLIPKKSNYCCEQFYEISFIDTKLNSVKLYSLFDKKCRSSSGAMSDKNVEPYIIMKFNFIQLCFKNDVFVLEYDNELGEKGVNWLNSVFNKKFTKLINSKINNKSIDSRLHFTSQIDILNYYKLYENLKLKYAKFLIENWPENTDPQKFVFEDIGIATYLLLLWNNGQLPDENSEKQKYFDLGCGNGLLVYILNSEGHRGVGYDVRKRKIWNMYPASVVLKEEAVVPGPLSTYPDADWLIGNHSDELTPWLPVMARRSGPQCQYFVLPCCPFKLDGRVYQRKNSKVSTYHDFIGYVQNISRICEFETHVDKLRIPSTKRICVIGKRKHLSPDELNRVQSEIDEFIADESATAHQTDPGTERDWIPEFKIRQSVEAVRNCTQLPKDFIGDLVLSIARNLLSRMNTIKVGKGIEIRDWNQGGSLPLRDLADLIPQEHLKRLKNECKGIQTLIKNHHHVFCVRGGLVRLRSPEEMMTIALRVSSGLKWKQKDCWFYSNHPDGCPLSEDDCSYKHG